MKNNNNNLKKEKNRNFTFCKFNDNFNNDESNEI